MNPLVIIGTGIAGYTLARELRKLDKEMPVVMLSSDDGCSYYKPKLSSAFTDGKDADQLIMATPDQMSRQLSANVRPFTPVSSIDTGANCIRIGAESLSYSRLVLALGADPVRVPIQGDAATRVLSVNDRADYARFRAAVADARHVLIMGAGLIGCEFANDLLSAGIPSCVVDPAAAPLGRLLPAGAAAALSSALAAAGVEWRFGATVARVDIPPGTEHARLAVTLSNGDRIMTDVVLSAIGLRPRTTLASAAGLAVQRGIVVDRQLQSTAPEVYALGDCAEVEGLVLPYVAPILQCARALARTLTGTPTPVDYPAMPVLVKTSRHPVVVCPPPVGVEGHWEEARVEDGVRATFRDESGRLLGFALTGVAVSEKAALALELPPLLP